MNSMVEWIITFSFFFSYDPRAVRDIRCVQRGTREREFWTSKVCQEHLLQSYLRPRDQTRVTRFSWRRPYWACPHGHRFLSNRYNCPLIKSLFITSWFRSVVLWGEWPWQNWPSHDSMKFLPFSHSTKREKQEKWGNKMILFPDQSEYFL